MTARRAHGCPGLPLFPIPKSAARKPGGQPLTLLKMAPGASVSAEWRKIAPSSRYQSTSSSISISSPIPFRRSR